MKDTLKKLWPFLRPYGGRLAGLLALMTASNLLALAGPYFSGKAVGAIGVEAAQADLPAAFLCCAVLLACYALSAALNYLLSAGLIRVGQGVSEDLRRAAFDRLTELPVQYFDVHPAGGDLISRVCYDVDTVNGALSADLLQMSTSCFTVAGSFVMLLVLSRRLACVFFVTVPLALYLTRWQMRRIRPLYRLRSRALGTLNGFAEERMACRQALRAYCVEGEDVEQFRARNRAASEAYYRADATSSTLGPSVNFINNISLAAVSVFGSLLYLGGGLPLSSLTSFVLYSRKFSGPIREAANELGDLQAALAAAERVLALLEEPVEPESPPEAPKPREVRGALRFDHVTFGYDAQRPVLRDFTADIPAGSLVAVVGPTGAGKTTLVSLLLRYYAPQSGSITLDGVPIGDYDRDALRRRLALVLQDTWLFEGTVAENIAYGSPGATREEIVRAAKDAHIHRFIQSLPDGYDTVLRDGGGAVSKGQRQLLAIARCFLTKADVVILDEATSNVDTETERAISAAMERLREGRTCFVIAHRLSTIRGADRILVLRGGAVAEQGTHEELLAAGGVYAELVRSGR